MGQGNAVAKGVQEFAKSLDSGQQPVLEPRHLRLLMALVSGALFMEILDGTIIVTALPNMGKGFGTTAVALNLGVSAYLLALGVFIPVSSWVAERFGVRRVFGLAIALFTLASAICGVAGGITEFVAARVVQGVAGAMMVPIGRLLLARFVPKEQLMAALSSTIWPALFAPIIGPPLGGFITLHLGWRWIFYLNVPLGIVALIMAFCVVPLSMGERRPFDGKGFALTGLGILLLFSGLESFAAGPSFVRGFAVLTGVSVLVAAVRHLAVAKAPMIELAAWRVPSFRISIEAEMLSRVGIGSAPFLLPLMFQTAFGYDAFHAGLLLLALFAGNLLMKAAATPILRRYGYRLALLVNSILAALAIAACALLEPDTPVAATCVVLFVGGLTRSFQFTILVTLGLADVEPADLGHANALYTTVTQLATAAAVTVAAIALRGFAALGATRLSGWIGGEFRLAFLVMSAIVLGAAVRAASLDRAAGDHFVGRSRRAST